MNEGLDRAVVCYLSSKIRAHKLWVWNHSHSAEVESVSVPTCRNRWVIMVLAIGVPYARVMEKVEMIIRHVVGYAAKCGGILCTACSMAVVRTITFAAAIVKEGKEAHNSDVGSGARR